MRWLAILVTGLVAHAEKTFVYCSEASPSSFNSQLVEDGVTITATSMMLFNRLVEFETGTTKIRPALATRWDVSPDGRTYVFHLRDDVWFHKTPRFTPTRPFNADDVVFSFERALKNDHPYHRVGGGNYIFFASMEFDKLIRAVTKVDERTVKFRLAHAEAPFLADLAMHFAIIHSAEYADQLARADQKERIDTDPVGTGPFVFRRYVRDNVIRYDANPRYWAGRPKLDHVVFSITPDASVRTQMLKSGECHLIAAPPPQDLGGLGVDPRVRLVRGAGANVGYLAINVRRPPFDKVDVRRAIAMALNRDNYIEVIFKRTATLATNPLPPTVWGADPNPRPIPYDPKAARALLAKAGFPDGFDTELWTLPVTRPYNPNGKKMGELMQADLAKIGVRAKLVTFDWPTYLARSRLGEHALMQLGWVSDNGDPDNFLGSLLSCGAVATGGNSARWCDPAFDALVTKARLVTDQRRRAELYVKAQKIFADALPWVPLAHATEFRGLTPNVTGYVVNPLGTEELYGVDLK